MTYVLNMIHICPNNDNHTGRGVSKYIYTYIMHNASTQNRKVNAYIPRAWPKIWVQENKQGSP